MGNILKRHGIVPAPERRTQTTWKEFIRTHLDVLAATDFFTAEGWTGAGLITYLRLVFYSSKHPPGVLGGQHRPSHPKRGCAKWPATSPWTRWVFSCGCRYLLQDRDPKFTHGFGQILAAAGVESVRLPPRSPNLNAVAER